VTGGSAGAGPAAPPALPRAAVPTLPLRLRGRSAPLSRLAGGSWFAFGAALAAASCSGDDAAPLGRDEPAGGPRLSGASGIVHHVATTGSDGNDGTSAATAFLTVQKAVDVAGPGDRIEIHGGTYSGRIDVTTAGAEGSPIVLTRADADSQPVLTAALASVSCSATSPTEVRTVTFAPGASHWLVEGLRIDGGILVEGTNAEAARAFIRDRNVPGRSTNDPSQEDAAYAYIGSVPNEGVEIVNNVLRRRGIVTLTSRRGRIEGNDISVTECSGPGILVNTFSDEWLVTRNVVHDNVATEKHFMNEGIRVGGNSAYNVVSYNTVRNIANLGRGIALDVNASWNVITRNSADRTANNYSQQAGGWGNEFSYNLSQNSRKHGFGILRKGTNDDEDQDRVPAFLTYTCNQSLNEDSAFEAGGVRQSDFLNNFWTTADLDASVVLNWAADGNTWNGGSSPPPARPSMTGFADCGTAPPLVPVEFPPEGGAITLSARGYIKRSVHKVDLTWSGATSAQVDVWRNGRRVATTANDGFHTDSIRRTKPSYVHKICHAGTTFCSNEVTTAF
jgi:hypothetical protein